MNKKELVIITGVTGAIGNALLAKYAPNAIVYGISRKALSSISFIDPNTSKLYPNTFICKIGELNKENINTFINSIDIDRFSSITYFHSLGLYPFEINSSGEHIVENDEDKDGVNDITHSLTYEVFRLFTLNLKNVTNKTKIPCRSLIFGSLADKHEPLVHSSWWKTIKKTKEYMKETASENFAFHLINISSVSCSHEIITRPYIFIHTDAKIQYWLQPHELVKKIYEKNNSKESFHDFHEYEIFNKLPQFQNTYYEDKNFTPRKFAEVF